METQYNEISYLNETVEIIQFLSESNEQFVKRLEFIKKLENNKISWNTSLVLSKIYYNYIFKKCRYTPGVFNMIKKYL